MSATYSFVCEWVRVEGPMYLYARVWLHSTKCIGPSTTFAVRKRTTSFAQDDSLLVVADD